VAIGRRRDVDELSGAARMALRALVASPKFELIPLKNALGQAAALPPGAQVTVTASPSHTIEATLDLAEAVSAQGHAVIPHLSAHMIHDRAHLASLVQRMQASGLRRVFIVGGDSKEPGEFRDGLSLIRAIEDLGRPFDEIGVPSYPEGHVDIPDDVLLRALRDKEPHASYMATQICFNPEAIVSWIARMRREGVRLPIHLGTPGVADVKKLMTIATRIGIADSARYLKKHRRLVGHLLQPGRFGPDALLEGMAPVFGNPEARVESLHLFTFNQVAATVEWQRRMLDELDELDEDGAEEIDA
jgi:methylenetetrahydrofolate reductase (NADPH)